MRNTLLVLLLLGIVACVASLVVSIVRENREKKASKARRFWPFLLLLLLLPGCAESPASPAASDSVAKSSHAKDADPKKSRLFEYATVAAILGIAATILWCWLRSQAEDNKPGRSI